MIVWINLLTDRDASLEVRDGGTVSARRFITGTPNRYFGNKRVMRVWYGVPAVQILCQSMEFALSGPPEPQPCRFALKQMPAKIQRFIHLFDYQLLPTAYHPDAQSRGSGH